MPGIEPGAFHMQSERSTTELHPLRVEAWTLLVYINKSTYIRLAFVLGKVYSMYIECNLMRYVKAFI